MKLRVRSWVYNPDLRDQFLDEYFQDAPPDREINKWIWAEAQNWFSWNMLGKTSVALKKSKIWIAAGENDSVPVSQMQKLACLIPGSRLTIYEKCGHIPWLEHPQRFYKELKEFIFA